MNKCNQLAQCIIALYKIHFSFLILRVYVRLLILMSFFVFQIRFRFRFSIHQVLQQGKCLESSKHTNTSKQQHWHTSTSNPFALTKQHPFAMNVCTSFRIFWLILCPYTSLDHVCFSLSPWISVLMIGYIITHCTCTCPSLDPCFSPSFSFNGYISVRLY